LRLNDFASVCQAWSTGRDGYRPGAFRSSDHDKRASLIQFASIALVRSWILPVSVPNGGDDTGAADGKLHFLVCMRLQSSVPVNGFNGNK
jgi:hypothetical protein